MKQIQSTTTMQRHALALRQQGVPLALVPTMGYLHAGHESLIRRARRLVGPKGHVIVSLYVNPTQFGPQEDFARYPRDLQHDMKVCRSLGVDTLFRPADQAVYPHRTPPMAGTFVEEPSLTQGMEGGTRPSHFRGVTTVVAKLFLLCQPDVAVFGAKDFQQAMVIRRMIKDLHFPIRLILSPTVRERDGLALSSRNVYLTPEQRAEAPVLYQCIKEARRQIRTVSSGIPRARLLQSLESRIKACPHARLDYVEFFDPQTGTPVRSVRRGTHMALAVYFGATRLIDNGKL